MKRFVELIQEIEGTKSSIVKTAALKYYFLQENSEEDKLWVVALFTGKTPGRPISTQLMRVWCAEYANIPLWLFEENYHIVGDLAETVALILPLSDQTEEKPLHVWMEELLWLKDKPELQKKSYLLKAWSCLDKSSIWVFNKLITGGFRIGVSKNILLQALSQTLNCTTNEVSYFLSGKWSPSQHQWKDVFDQSVSNLDLSKPYPFHLCHAINDNALIQIHPSEWIAEWKWDGIRCQFIVRQNQIFLWSRGEVLITDQFPEFKTLQNTGLSFVLDGEILSWANEKAGNFQALQKRLNRKNPGQKTISSHPIIFMVYDILEFENKDLRQTAFIERRKYLDRLIGNHQNKLWKASPMLKFEHIADLENLRKESSKINAEGLMLKKQSGIYESGRKVGNMWKWKVDPLTIDGVLIYAQRGHGRRASLFSDYTFALWSDGQLIPFAKAYSGLTDAEMAEITKFVKKNTTETYGPVCKVVPDLVFELAFEGVALSSRHKSGVAVRFPRILRWRKDKSPDQANSVQDLLELSSLKS